MKLFKKKSKKIEITRADALRFKPVKNVNVVETRLENGLLMLSYPLGVSPWAASLIRRFSKSSNKPVIKKVELDLLGSTVWDLIDGKRSVKQIIQKFAKNFQLHLKEAEASVTQFIYQLGKRGLIGLK